MEELKNELNKLIKEIEIIWRSLWHWQKNRKIRRTTKRNWRV